MSVCELKHLSNDPSPDLTTPGFDWLEHPCFKDLRIDSILALSPDPNQPQRGSLLVSHARIQCFAAFLQCPVSRTSTVSANQRTEFKLYRWCCCNQMLQERCKEVIRAGVGLGLGPRLNPSKNCPSACSTTAGQVRL